MTCPLKPFCMDLDIDKWDFLKKKILKKKMYIIFKTPPKGNAQNMTAGITQKRSQIALYITFEKLFVSEFVVHKKKIRSVLKGVWPEMGGAWSKKGVFSTKHKNCLKQFSGYFLTCFKRRKT